MSWLKSKGAQFRRPEGPFGFALARRMNQYHQPLYRYSLRPLNIQPEDQVLEVGCGGGQALTMIAERAFRGFVAGVDYSKDMVRMARLVADKAGISSRVKIYRADAASLPFQGCAFDKACSIESFYYWPHPVAALREILRLLKPGGILCVGLEGSKEEPGAAKAIEQAQRFGFAVYSGAEIVKILTEAGFGQAGFEFDPETRYLRAFGVKPDELPE